MCSPGAPLPNELATAIPIWKKAFAEEGEVWEGLGP